MSDDNRLRRAHQLSAEASVLIRPPDADAATLGRALEAYNAAADLFERAGTATEDANRGTLRMLTIQHRKLARDLERRIAGLGSGSSSAPPSPSTGNHTVSNVHAEESGGSSFARGAPSSPTSAAFSTGGAGAGLAGSSGCGPRRMAPRRASGTAVGLNAGRGGALGPPAHSATARSVPPFSLRPVGDVGATGSFAGQPGGAPGSTYDLHSSSSSSEQPDESFLLPGAIPESTDPFSRFWGMLENMLEEISMPTALTTAPLDVPPLQAGPSRSRRRKSKSNKERLPSPSESFYVVPRDNNKPSGTTVDRSEIGPSRISSPSVKTTEELLLENESLRGSLDALAVHAHQLELANRAFKERDQERDKLVRSVVSGVRREAQKARHDQEVIRSQVIASVGEVPNSHTSSNQPAAVSALKTRVVELEDQVKHLKGDNDKLRTQLDKFKEKWDKLKAKKEAKVAAAKQASSSRSPDPAA